MANGAINANYISYKAKTYLPSKVLSYTNRGNYWITKVENTSMLLNMIDKYKPMILLIFLS